MLEHIIVKFLNNVSDMLMYIHQTKICNVDLAIFGMGTMEHYNQLPLAIYIIIDESCTQLYCTCTSVRSASLPGLFQVV